MHFNFIAAGWAALIVLVAILYLLYASFITKFITNHGPESDAIAFILIVLATLGLPIVIFIGFTS